MSRTLRVIAALVITACGGIVTVEQVPIDAATSHPLVVIFMENHERASIVGSSSADYMNQLRASGIDFTHYNAVSHPSLPNYLALGNGSTDGKVGSDTISAGQIAGRTVWNQLTKAGVGFNVYMESMPAVCYAGTSSGKYVLRHNPATPFTRVYQHPPCDHVKPWSAGVALGAYNFISPNLCNDMHDCSISTGDNWLQAYVPTLLAQGATVVVTFDEGTSGTGGGGNVYTVVVGSGIAHRVDTATYNHYSLLAAVEKRFGLTRLNAAALATPLPLQ